MKEVIKIELNGPTSEEVQGAIDMLRDYGTTSYTKVILVTRDTHNTHFNGEINSKDFITYKELSERCFITEGKLNPVDHGWLKFNLDGKTLLVSKQCVRSELSWVTLYNAGVVAGNNPDFIHPTHIDQVKQNKRVLINDKEYIVRLLKGADSGIDQVSIVGYDTAESRQSEWSRIFYPIVTDDPNIKSYTGPRLANYTEVDLQMRYINATVTPGSYNWCQETIANSTANRVLRGDFGPSSLNWNPSSYVYPTYGWRACLELV